MALPPEAQKVINARALDAWEAMFKAVENESREDLIAAGLELVCVLQDDLALNKEHTGESRVDPDYRAWLEPVDDFPV